MSEMVDRIKEAISRVQLFSRFNDWTSDRVDGCPIEICRHGADGADDIVVARFGGAISEREALDQTVSEFRARAVLEALREPTADMTEAGTEYLGKYLDVNGTFTAMIDEALK